MCVWEGAERREVGEGGEGREVCGGGQGEKTTSRTLRTPSGAPTTFVAWPQELVMLLLLYLDIKFYSQRPFAFRGQIETPSRMATSRKNMSEQKYYSGQFWKILIYHTA